MNDLPPTKPARGFQGYAAGRAVSRVLSPMFRRRGFRHLPILERWHEIVGEQIAVFSRPERIRRTKDGGATLTLKVEGAMAVEVQHLAPLILERLNNHFGGAAIERLNVVQGHLDIPTNMEPRRPLSASEIGDARNTLLERESYPQDEALIQALARLGAYIKRDN